MEILFLYLLGVIVFALGYYLYFGLYDKNPINSNKLIIYRGFKYGMFSWISVIVGIAILFIFEICDILFRIDDYFEERL